MPSNRPRHPDPWPFADLTDDEFDELVYLLAHSTDARVVKTRAPDGGLDTVRPLAANPLCADWGVQAKLHRQHIHWSECKQSLDRAVAVWRVRSVTFTFPRDLTHKQHANFCKHLASRHAGVTVNWWGPTKLTALMLAADAGAAIAKRFFHAEDPADLVDRAARAGGPLRTVDDLLKREFAAGEFLRTADPHFTWVTTKRRRAPDEPAPAPGTVMRLNFARGDEQLIADAVPRAEASGSAYGLKGAFVFADPERRQHAERLLEAVVSQGGRADLGEATMRFDRIPAPFDELLANGFRGEVRVRAHRKVPPWAALMRVDTDEGTHELEVDLVADAPEDEWDAKLVGERHGLRVELRFVWSHSDGRGSLNLTWHFCRARGTARQRADIIAFVIALHGHGKFAVIDREQQRPELREATTPARVPHDLRVSERLYRDWATVERFAGRPLGPPPDEFTLEEANWMAWLASAVVAGGCEIDLESANMVCDSSALTQFKRAGSDLEIRQTMVMTLFDRELEVAQQTIKLPLMQVKQAVRQRGVADAWEVQLVPAAAPSVRVWATLAPLGSRQGAELAA